MSQSVVTQTTTDFDRERIVREGHQVSQQCINCRGNKYRVTIRTSSKHIHTQLPVPNGNFKCLTWLRRRMAPTGTYDISRCLLWNLVPVEMLFVVGQRWSWCWGVQAATTLAISLGWASLLSFREKRNEVWKIGLHGLGASSIQSLIRGNLIAFGPGYHNTEKPQIAILSCHS